MADFFFKHEHNPNDTTGGGACLATGGIAGEDCRGPWYNFHRCSTEYHASPHATICQYHLDELNARAEDEVLQTEGDPLPLRQAVPVTREDTGMPDFVGVAGTPSVEI